MAIFTTADGRQIVGAAQAGNEYKGYAGRREIVIQLTATGATQDSLDALEFLKSYALYHNSVGEPIFPASTNVFISNNGVTKAVEADEVTVDGANVNIGGCVWNGTAWDFTNAGQSGGGGSSGGGVLLVNITNPESDVYVADKTYNEVLTAYQSGQLCLYALYGSVCVVAKDEGHPELYGFAVSVSQNAGGGGTLSNVYIEYTTSGVTVSTDKYSLTAEN